MLIQHSPENRLAHFDAMRAKSTQRATRRAANWAWAADAARGAFVCVAFSVLAAAPARAETEPVTLFDARSVGMGGTGTAFIDNGAAVYHNPANLARSSNFVFTAAFTPSFARFSAPFTGPGSEQNSTTPMIPFGLIGAGLRVHERVVVGAGAYINAGAGAHYQRIGALGGLDQKMQLGLAEIVVPVAVKITDTLSLGAGVRAVYGTLTTDIYNAGFMANVHGDVNGWGIPGFSAGALWQPLEMLRVGLMYRSSVAIDLKGKSTVPMAGAFDTTSTWKTPHAIRLGTALSLLEKRLTLALDVRYQMYEQSSKELVTDIDTTAALGMPVRDVRQLKWKNAIGGALGFEYHVAPEFALRAGYAITTSATPSSTAMAFALTPGMIQALTLGAGVHASQFVDVDFGLVYAFGSKNVAQTVNGSPGKYGYEDFTLSGSLTVKL